MAWTTQITNKIIIDGLLKVVVEFSDGIQTFKDRYETRNAQDANWLNYNIARRISDLEGVVAFADTIPIGTFTPTAIVTEVVVDETKLTPKEKYARKLKKLESLISAIKKGIISETDVDFIATKQWLIDNWSINYFDLF